MHTVLEATSKSRPRAELARSTSTPARSASSRSRPPADAPDLLAVRGSTKTHPTPEQRIVSNASSTVHAVAPVLRILHDAFGIRARDLHDRALLHEPAAAWPTCPPRTCAAGARRPRTSFRRSPARRGCSRRFCRSSPEGSPASAMNVPVANGSVVDLVCWHREARDAGRGQRGVADRRRDRALAANPPVRARSRSSRPTSRTRPPRASSTRSPPMTLAGPRLEDPLLVRLGLRLRAPRHRAARPLRGARRRRARDDPRRHQRLRPDRPLGLPDPVRPPRRRGRRDQRPLRQRPARLPAPVRHGHGRLRQERLDGRAIR